MREFLISWFHPMEHSFDLDVPFWATGRNEDFGYETLCATVVADDKESAERFIRSNYNSPGFNIGFRFCSQKLSLATPNDGVRADYPAELAAA